jgi:hypothetical protein
MVGTGLLLPPAACCCPHSPAAPPAHLLLLLLLVPIPCAGARLATLLARLPYIPAADALVCEGGGRIFYPTPAHELPTAAPLAEDLAWRELQAAAAGPAGQDGVPPEDREGTLWRFYAQIQQQAAALGGKQLRADAASYTTAFRLKGAPDAVAAALSSLPPTLTTAVNLGAADVFPATSGKASSGRQGGTGGVRGSRLLLTSGCLGRRCGVLPAAACQS